MPNTSDPFAKDCLLIGHSGRFARKMICVLAGMAFLTSSIVAGEPANDPTQYGERSNPFVGSPWPGRAQETTERMPTSLSPVAKVRLQVPQVKTVSTAGSSVFVGPSWDVQQRDTRANPAELPVSSPLALAIVSMETPNATTRPTRLPTTLPNPQTAIVGNSSHPTKLASAAKKRSDYLSNQPQQASSSSSVYLATRTAQSQFGIAGEQLQQAQLEFDCSAFASAETSVWQSLERSAQAIDLADASAKRTAEEFSALKRLHQGRRALIEACDFVGPFAQQDPTAIARLARAHETPVLRETLPPMRTTFSRFDSSASELPTASEAIDRYLDYARMQFSVLSSKSLLAAQTLDLLAAIRLGRNELSQLPGPTAICLRRAAVQGQSSNADLVAKLGHHLADVGLIDEARWALRHSLTLQSNRNHAARLAALDAAAMRAGQQERDTASLGSSVLAATRPPNRTPDVITMSPEQFAAISQSVMPGQSADRSGTESLSATNHTTPTHSVSSQTVSAPSSEQKQSFMRAFTASFRTDPAGASVLPHQGGPPQPPARMSSRSLPVIKKWW